ncbi:PD-(D/E)XK nuclease family transposase [Hominifimenecus sp. rT4P-3]|uniref:PD-(D/E)XK nuclease family transposase n=1 Tax=Hominifimenecus sp. rT4P-3 TaxID=3242979 RepID=UPI003DA4ADD9
METKETIGKKHQEDLQRLRGFRLLDDEFLTKCFEDGGTCVEFVLRLVLERPDLQVVDVHTQVFVENLLNRSVRLDILATDSAGAKMNVEIQRSDKGAGRKRARYNSSMMDVNLLEKGEDFEKLPETWVIFITEHDVMKEGKPVYPIERCFLETGKRFEDGSHILYVNGAYRGDTPMGKLMHDFACTDPADMYYEVLAERVRFFKESKEGRFIMSKVLEDMRQESWKEGNVAGIKQGIRTGIKKGIKTGIETGTRTVALRMLETGKYAVEEIAELSGLSHDEVRKLQEMRQI